MLKLTRKGDRVYHNNVELKINPQASKGPGAEVVKLSGIADAEGREWISLSLLQEGENIFTSEDLKKRQRKGRDYELTEEEQAQVDELQRQIDVIIDAARSRYVPPVKKKLEDMNLEELEAYIAMRKAKLQQVQQ
jgi:hypothetical protein